MLTVVAFDLEFTAWEGSMRRNWSSPGEHREVVQIGAVRFAVPLGPETAPVQAAVPDDEFACVVRPAVNPVLSDYLIALTGLNQQEVDDGRTFGEALAAFGAFCSGSGLICCNGIDNEVLLENCRLNQLVVPDWLDAICNVDRMLARALHHTGPQIPSTMLPRRVGLSRPYRAHWALDDARAVAHSIAKLAATDAAFATALWDLAHADPGGGRSADRDTV